MGPNPTYDVAYPYSSFKFDRSFYVNTTMMGEDVSYPVGDPNGSGLLYVQDLEKKLRLLGRRAYSDVVLGAIWCLKL